MTCSFFGENQGGTHCLISGCHIETGTKSGGLRVATNYSANVKARDITFVVPVWRKFAIVQEGWIFLPGYFRQAELLGSKAVICQNNQIFVGTLPKAPTLEELKMRELSGERWLMHSRCLPTERVPSHPCADKSASGP